MAVTRRRKHAHHDEEHENEERWLVSFADMMTLLMCLFMVLFSISSVNVSKLEVLQVVLEDAFSGRILPGGKATMQPGASDDAKKAAPEQPVPAISPLESLRAETSQTNGGQSAPQQRKAAEAEDEEFHSLKRRIDALAEDAGLKGRVKTTVRRRGLVVELLTDNVFFASGSSELQPGADGVLRSLAKVIAGERRHPVIVEGHTDAQPISDSRYRSNWELSGARAATVVRRLNADGVTSRRLSGSLYGQQQPVASNATPTGRSRNRRVDIVLTRLNPAASTRP
jgi:chemotaxis protein MotB